MSTIERLAVDMVNYDVFFVPVHGIHEDSVQVIQPVVTLIQARSGIVQAGFCT